MLLLKRTDSDNPDFQNLVVLLDEYLAEKDGDDHSFYNQFNQLNKIQHVVVAYADERAVGCGAIKKYSDEIAEVKRMFVHPEFRGQKIGKLVLSELEAWADELGFSACILETGQKQPEAVRLYERSGYGIIPNYDQYIGVENSVCMKKPIRFLPTK
jgi:putative acetyltransferase